MTSAWTHTRRSLLVGIGSSLACIGPVGQSTAAELSLGNTCLPGVLYGEQTDDRNAVTKGIVAEIARERRRVRQYSEPMLTYLREVALAARRISDGLALSTSHGPRIILAEKRGWRAVDRRHSDDNKDTILLWEAALHASADGSAKPQRFLYAILAHEFAHAFQFARHFDHGDTNLFVSAGTVRTIRELELHADFMAGFALARSEEQYGSSLELLHRFSDTIFDLGDFKLANCDHHGTPAERYTMMMKGYIEAQRDRTLRPEMASQTGLNLLDELLRVPASNPQPKLCE